MRRAIHTRAPEGSEDTRSFVAPSVGAFSMGMDCNYGDENESYWNGIAIRMVYAK